MSPTRPSRHPTEAERDERFSTAPLGFEEAIKVALATRPEDVDDEDEDQDAVVDAPEPIDGRNGV